MKFYTNFPRQVGKYRNGIVKSERELIQYVNRWNGKRDIFTSVYAYDDIHNPDVDERFRTAIIDRIYWDLDPQDDKLHSVENRVLRLSAALSDDSAPHIIKASGTGFGLYAFTDDFPVAPDKKKTTVKIIQEHYDEKAGGISGDRTSYGDIARISRIPGTLNMKYRNGLRRYCVFVPLQSVENRTYMSKYVTTGTQGNGYIHGSKPIELAHWENLAETYVDSSGLGIYDDGIDSSVEFETDWWCINQSLEKAAATKRQTTNRERYIIINHLFNTGFTSQQANGIILKTFSKYNNAKTIEEGMIKSIYSRGLRFPAKTTLKREARCNDCGQCEEIE